MFRGLSDGGKTLYQQWRYGAGQLADLLATYGSIGASSRCKTALERTISEINNALEAEK